MILQPAVYDLRELVRSNMHVHTTFSRCAKPGMQIEAIIAEARRCGLSRLAITDHYNVPGTPILEQNSQLRERAGETPDLTLLFGAELSVCGIGKYLDPPEVNRALDFRLYAYNHFHLDIWDHPEDRSPRGYVGHSLEVLRHLFHSGRADSIAHPFYGGKLRHVFEDPTTVTRALTDAQMGDIMSLGRDSDCSWELHVSTVLSDPEFGRRYFNIGRELGVSFQVGTDAHHLSKLDPTQFLGELERILS